MEQVLKNVRRFNSLSLALSTAERQTYWVPVLLGDDGKYWVPGTNREAGQLIKAGYEEVK